mgnify:FL=1|tara:strand:+ start:962 stop:1297 length:336 start_codon:yes stop_codon:yes gene_type:complete
MNITNKKEMNAKELRLDNWVINPFGTLFQITVIDERMYDFKPIPLTEEWLVKFGFEYDVLEEFYFEINDIRGQFYEEENSFELDHYELANCYYVHQLQNLYFALTGQELEI